MFKQVIRRLPRVSFPVVIVGALLLIVGASAIAVLLMRNNSEASVNGIQPYAARIDKLDGEVGIARVEDENKPLDWGEATINTPVSIGDRIYARDNSHASIALSARDYVRLNPLTTLDVLSLEDLKTQLALRDGSALFDVGELNSGELYEVATPYGAVDFLEPGLYQVGIDGNNAIISVLSGLAQVVGSGGSGYINKGEVLTLVGALAAQALSSKLAPNLAGDIVDDYYGYRYPDVYDGRYVNYDSYLSDPFYYDPYRTSASYRYLDADIPGIYDLDYYGDWHDLSGYGHCWSPRVSSGWAPFRSGFWELDDLWGPSWVSSEPWGWAPYHYGRWAFVDSRWFWVPGRVTARQMYSPAPVAFIPVAEQIAWVPLAPGEVYVQRYYDASFTPRYLASPDVINLVTVQKTFVNFNAPGAVTLVPVRSLTRTIDPSFISTVDPRLFEKSHHVIDPFSVADIRQLAVSRRDARRRLKFERAEQLAFNRAVVTSATPETVRFRSDITNALRVEEVSQNQKRNKLRINTSSDVTTLRDDRLPRPAVVSQQRIAELAGRANQGDKSARRQMRQLVREQQRAAQQPQAAQQQLQQEQKTRQELRQQRKAEREHQMQSAGQQEAFRQAQQQQLREQRKAQRQQQSQAAAQQEAARQAQQQQLRQQRKLQRQQQQTPRPQVQQPMMPPQAQQQTRQQRKEQKRLQRRPPQAFNQPQQMRQIEAARVQQAARQAQMMQHQQQIKAQQRAERQRSMIQQQQQNQHAAMQAAQQRANQAREQARDQRRAERQQQMIVQQRAPVRAVAPQVLKNGVTPGTPSRQDARAQRKAEKAQRRQP